MGFSLPVFNLMANRWRPPNAPPAAPDASFICQLYFGSRAYLDITPGILSQWHPPVFLRCPTGTDLQIGDIVEVNAGDGWFYNVRWTDRVHRGFTNEYFVGVLEHGTATPPPPPPPPGASSVLMEDGSFVLNEVGGKILME